MNETPGCPTMKRTRCLMKELERVLSRLEKAAEVCHDCPILCDCDITVLYAERIQKSAERQTGEVGGWNG